ncbi:glycosyltransferase [Terrisporobacter vanillatitrophus]|uniref:glycosyltransferase n=1 Tax=Terrisporobacter vanillatitrophus TaxID=3058402 RepID=UPI00336980C6
MENNRLELINYKNNNYNKSLNNKLLKLISNMPDSNGSRYFKKIDKNIGIVTDEFMYNYYKDSVSLIYISSLKYKEIIENNKIDMFLFVTCWRGMEDNDWRGRRKQESIISKITRLCKSKNIPTLFQSIEDPSNYNIFINIAKEFDYIFTTDKDKIEDYKNDCNNENVYLSMFGVNPLFHNPIGIKNNKKLKEVLFAGSWMTKYPHRCNDMKKIFDGVLSSNRELNIIDRNFNENAYFYPKEYIPYTSPAINHKDLQKIHKLYDWIVNVNSIKYSPTMCAMRCYEAQALGNAIISNYSIAVNNNNPNIFIVHDSNEVKYILDSFNEEEIYKHQIYGIRNVMSDKCVFNRIENMIKKVYPHFYMNLNKKVLVVAKKITPIIKVMFDRQIYEYKYLVEEDKAKKIYNEYDFIAFFKEDYFYEEYYLQDMINGFKYTDSDYITKDSYYRNNQIVVGIEHNYVNQMKDKYKTVFDIKVFNLDFLLSLNNSIYLNNGYSIDHFELNMKDSISNNESDSVIKKIYNNFRNKFKSRDANTSDNKEDVEFLQENKYKFSVIVPIYNNGRCLLNKCFNSLKRSTMFKDMEIVLIDDGSSDKDTLVILERLNRENENIKLYKFNDISSGSASRPRNKGIEISTTDYITFLDPDNEAVNDGYAKLYKKIVNSDYDLVLGNMLKVGNKENVMKNRRTKIIENPRQYEINNKFPVNSIQAIMIRKNFILENNLKMVNGAIGQDTLFFIELMLNAKRIKIIEDIIHIYYAAVTTSITNNKSISFFEKSLLLEKEMAIRLDSYGVKKEYIYGKLEYFYKNWYMSKLKNADKSMVIEITRIMLEILNAYNYMNIQDKYIKDFVECAKAEKYDEIEKIYF